MDRAAAVKLLRDCLDEHKLIDWSIRLNQNPTAPFLGLCSHKDKCIILNAHHIDQHPEVEITNTIRHEVAHALVGAGHAHDSIWAECAKRIGCDNVAPCASFSLSPQVIDAIRSGAEIEIIVDEQVVRNYSYRVTRLQDKCETCGKVAIFDREVFIKSKDDFTPDKKIIFFKCNHFRIKELPKATPFHSIVANGRKDCKHEWTKNKCLICGANRPFEFQLEGMRFAEAALATGKGVGIFDDMGLGKTIQALGVLKFHPELFPVAFGVKSAIKFNWFKAILNWMGDEYLPQIIQSSTDIVIPGLKCYIFSYDMLVFKTRKSKKTGKTINQGFDVKKFIDAGIKTIVLDECQQLKNPDSSRTQEIRKLAKHTKVIALSGTPWKNNGSEFFSVLNMIDPVRFPSYTGFVDRWVQDYWDGNKHKLGGIQNVKAFREFTKDFLIRRERVTVLPELPIIDRQQLYIQLEEMESRVYNEEVSSFVKWWNEKVINGEEASKDTGIHLLAKLSRLRHITGLAKIPATMEFIEQFMEQSESKKILIGVHHIDVMDILYNELKEKYTPEGITVLKITGQMGSQEKYEVQEKFNASASSICVASTLAAGEGMNLQTCSNLIMHERQWNPQNEQQFEDRIIRIGQESKQITGTYVLGADTVDDLFTGIVESKRNAFHKSMNTNELSNPGWKESELMIELANAIVSKFNKTKRAVA
jgi:hypothetical protein